MKLIRKVFIANTTAKHSLTVPPIRDTILPRPPAASIKKEYTLGKCRSDIALLDKEKKALAVVEVVVTHPPEQEVLQYYKDNRITLVHFNLTSDEDLIKVEEIAKKPDIVDMCMNPECIDHEKYTIKRKILWRRILCGSRLHEILEYRVGIDSIFGRQLSTNFTKDEIDWVRSNFNNIITVIP